ncbi:hypothetical protein OROGR_004774 [Orobanche gracilis]
MAKGYWLYGTITCVLSKDVGIIASGWLLELQEQYLHEGCEPPIIHRNLKSANVLLDDELVVFISDCDLAPLFLSGAVNQVSA